jgi:hypothetical protein
MKFHLVEDYLPNLQFHMKESENGIWQLYILPVMYGFRVQIARKDGAGPEIDYCGGTNEEAISLIYTLCEKIMNHLLEDMTYRRLHEAFPEWRYRPVWKDELFMDDLKQAADYVDDEVFRESLEELPSLAIMRIQAFSQVGIV